jgi:hypothetical protein
MSTAARDNPGHRQTVIRSLRSDLSNSVEALAHSLGLPKRLMETQGLRFPDGSLHYPPRLRWCILIKAIVEHFCPEFAPGGVVMYLGDAENKFIHLEAARLAGLGVTLDSAAKIPDLVVHYPAKNWLLLIEAVTSAGPIDGKRREKLKDLFAGSRAGLVFVTAFETRRVTQSFLSQIAWDSEVWIAESPDHMIHFNGDRFLGPYPDVVSK